MKKKTNLSIDFKKIQVLTVSNTKMVVGGLDTTPGKGAP